MRFLIVLLGLGLWSGATAAERLSSKSVPPVPSESPTLIDQMRAPFMMADVGAKLNRAIQARDQTAQYITGLENAQKKVWCPKRQMEIERAKDVLKKREQDAKKWQDLANMWKWVKDGFKLPRMEIKIPHFDLPRLQPKPQPQPQPQPQTPSPPNSDAHKNFWRLFYTPPPQQGDN